MQFSCKGTAAFNRKKGQSMAGENNSADHGASHRTEHQYYNGKQKEYEERTKAKKKAQIDSQKEQIRAEDREKGIYFHAGVPNIPRAGKQAVM